MSLILNIETATEVCSVCLSENGKILSSLISPEKYDHAGSLTLLIQSCMGETGIPLHEIDAVAISSGPGSYTALRVGASVAKGICFGLDKPLIAVSTLQSLALASLLPEDGDWLYCPMIDARRMEVYTALFDRNHHAVTNPSAMILDQSSFEEYFQQGRTLVFSGNGSRKFRDLPGSEKAVFRDVRHDASLLAPLAHQAFHAGSFQDPAYYAPLYLKPPNITKPKKLL